MAMDDRITIVNNRLECLRDLLALLRAQRHDSDGFKLVGIIILLLIASAVVSFIKAVEILFP